MPYSPQRPCRANGCPNLAERGHLYCKKHLSIEYKYDHDKSAHERGYTSRWHKARTAYLNKHPLCVECAKRGQYVKATVVDHIIPHRGDHKLFWDQGNWQSLCKSCHDEKTGREDRWNEWTY